MEDLLQRKGRSFEQAVIQKASVAAAPLAAWVKANIEYASAWIRRSSIRVNQ